MIRSGHRLLQKITAAKDGAVAALMAIAAVPLLAAVGLAIDGARGYQVKSRLSQALDAAALAGGRAVFSERRDDDIRMFFSANFPTGYMGAEVSTPEIHVDAAGETIAVAASAVLPTTFMRVVGIDTMTVRADVEVKRANRGMELVLVMDNTGSMASNGKINAMRDAASDLVQILYGARETIPNFWIGLVPYVATVNIGPTRTDWLAPGSYNAANYLPGTWKGCVQARSSPYEEASAETLPSAQPFLPFLWASTKTLYPSNGDNNWTPINETVAAGNNATGPNLGCGPAITPLQTSKSAALAAIVAMGPWSRGGTMGNLGLAWGWRLLSPAWRGLWGAPMPDNLPLDYNTPLVDKVIVMLTDGNNEWYAGPSSSQMPNDHDYTAYGRLSEGRLGTTNATTATNTINTRMSTLCTAMKAKGIIIYTVVLQVNSAATQNLYRSCASKPEYYFLSPNSGDLAAIFREIATQLSNLRLSR